jgi:hypothetical protein
MPGENDPLVRLENLEVKIELAKAGIERTKTAILRRLHAKSFGVQNEGEYDRLLADYESRVAHLEKLQADLDALLA